MLCHREDGLIKNNLKYMFKKEENNVIIKNKFTKSSYRNSSGS